MITWVIGAGGLLGRALAAHCGETYSSSPVSWSDPDAAAEQLHQQARSFESAVGHLPWRVIWAAGAATTASPRSVAMSEIRSLQGLLTGLRSALPSGPGCFFLTSSAGAVYAGSSNPPFSVPTAVRPLSPYGELKVAQEALVQDLLAPYVPCAIGRISNLYGPGQDLTKLQGLISRLSLSALTQEPLNIFVPLDTIRDYIFVDDAARAICALTGRPGSTPGATVHLLASGRATTIGQLIRTTSAVAKRRVPVALGTHPSASAQALDLRLVPTMPLPRVTTLPAGVKATHDDILTRIAQSTQR